MKLFNEIKLRFDAPIWALYPELALFDVILEKNPNLVQLVSKDVLEGIKGSNFGRKDSPTVEQVLRAAIYKEIKQLDYRTLEKDMYDSKLCSIFLKLEYGQAFSYSVMQKYISKISEDSIKDIIKEINILAIQAEVETVETISPDTTVIETNIHYPTNNSLVWDCITTATNLLKKYKKEKKQEQENKQLEEKEKKAKALNFKINNTKDKARQKELFAPYLQLFIALITECKVVILTDNLVSKFKNKIEKLIPVMEQVYSNAYRFQINGEKVLNEEKLFSIFEQHTNIIVKGQRDVEFGHKVLITRGSSNMILDHIVKEGNPADSDLYEPTVENVIKNYAIIPTSTSSDGGFASNANLLWSKVIGIVNTVFTKVTKNMHNIVSNLEIENILKKWRGGTEAVISNLKRGFGLQRVVWEGWEHFTAKVGWSVLGYNLRVFTKALII